MEQETELDEKRSTITALLQVIRSGYEMKYDVFIALQVDHILIPHARSKLHYIF